MCRAINCDPNITCLCLPVWLFTAFTGGGRRWLGVCSHLLRLGTHCIPGTWDCKCRSSVPAHLRAPQPATEEKVSKVFFSCFRYTGFWRPSNFSKNDSEIENTKSAVLVPQIDQTTHPPTRYDQDTKVTQVVAKKQQFYQCNRRKPRRELKGGSQGWLQDWQRTALSSLARSVQTPGVRYGRPSSPCSAWLSAWSYLPWGPLHQRARNPNWMS